jgi:hypothetical protein
MRSWAREPLGCACGRCGEPIAVGDPELLITIAGVRQAFVRCAACEKQFGDGDDPPADLPPLARHRAEPMAPAPPVFYGFTAKALAAALPFDWRARAAGREPGEEG